MPVGCQVVPDLDLDGFISFIKTWSKCASGQIASSFGFFHFMKCSTGGFLSLETFFWFPLLIALSGQFYFNEHKLEA
ncbi:hypothetical protein MANES_15G186866v8 [Manihot esculenta]|uniref:Uncharacterized protein n=1 Tax=Manihot esculenta TaxID=3983 RepID=A0ACB7GDQ5_MANES|nr:hypothetical protein MANES_15G186866v8 [Manihot esculenta]